LIALAQEAKREHLGQQFLQGEISSVDLANALSAELIQKIARESEPTEPQIEQYYIGHRKEFERTKARHIVISYVTAVASRSSRTSAEARTKADAISEALKRGADFAEVAARESDDQYTAAKGGDLGDVSPNQMEPAMDHSIWSLRPGETSAPFEGRFGYEIVRVESRRVLPLNESREMIVGNIKFLRTNRQRLEIIASTRITLKRTYIDSPLPCEVKTGALTK
jgi:parvulin-like peptidyl-prolyl isomerase